MASPPSEHGIKNDAAFPAVPAAGGLQGQALDKAPAAPVAATSTLSKMGFGTTTAAPAAASVAGEERVPQRGVRAAEQEARARALASQRRPSSMGYIAAACEKKKPWYRPTLRRLIRLFQVLCLIRWIVPLLRNYQNGSICPYAVICSTGLIEIGLLVISKTTALLCYPILALVFLSKCATLRTFVQHTYITEVMDLYGLHELHVSFGYEFSLNGILHATAHIVRYATHDPALLLACPKRRGGFVTLSGYIATVLLVVVLLSFGVEAIRRRYAFEVRKLLHMLSVPMMVALCFHHHRLLACCSFLLVAYGLDWAYSNLFKTFRVDAPHLFPIGNGVLVEFTPPPGFHCRSGQYFFVCAPYISKYEWHAFSGIPVTNIDGSLGCSFYSLACGDWTRQLLEAANKNVRRPLWINGAYPSPFDTSVKFDYLFLICTGIGITPGISIISQYCHSKFIVLVWVCRAQELIDLFKSEIQAVVSKVSYTGDKQQQKKALKDGRVEGSAVFCGGRPDLCAEIKNVILHKRPLGA